MIVLTSSKFLACSYSNVAAPFFRPSKTLYICCKHVTKCNHLEYLLAKIADSVALRETVRSVKSFPIAALTGTSVRRNEFLLPLKHALSPQFFRSAEIPSLQCHYHLHPRRCASESGSDFRLMLFDKSNAKLECPFFGSSLINVFQLWNYFAVICWSHFKPIR